MGVGVPDSSGGRVTWDNCGVMITESASRPPIPGSRLAATLWDFDGTLADTEPIWIAAEFELIPKWGGEWNDQHAHQLVGNALIDSGTYIAKVIGRDDLEPAWIVEQLLAQVVEYCRTQPIPWRPGALELLASLRAAGVPNALVSASYRELLDVIIERLPEGTFTASVAGDEVTAGKPDPEPYLTACKKLGVQPQDCVVFEDSPPGARSGGDSGAKVVVVENVVPVPDAPNQLKMGSLEELDADAVAGLLRRDGDDAGAG
jgi:HAD superfamily hydrolase (TIGR01509 family)